MIEKPLLYMLSLMVPELVWDWHYCSYCICVYFGLFCTLVSFHGLLFSVLSILLRKFVWLNDKVLTLLCFFLIMRMEISWFLREIFSSSTRAFQQPNSCFTFSLKHMFQSYHGISIIHFCVSTSQACCQIFAGCFGVASLGFFLGWLH